jgi:N-acetylglucosamine-6-phosphate deacetylase
MNCSGINLATGEPIDVQFGELIESVGVASGDTAGLPLLAPGWIDLQVNGYAGADFNSPSTSASEIGHALHELHAGGTTRIYATVITGSPGQISAALRNLAAARDMLPDGETIEGIHLEGPYISPDEGPRGAHPEEWIRPPDLKEFERFQESARGLIRLVTLSPHWPEAPRFIEELIACGVSVSIGHTGAVSSQIAAAVAAGASLSTHLGNAAPGMLNRSENCIWDQLASDALSASFIADGLHVRPALLKTIVRAKGVERCVLVTDAVAPAGCPPGSYKLGQVAVDLTAEGRVQLAGMTRLAGSVLRMDRAIENVRRTAGIPLSEAVAMATVNPARVGQVARRDNGLMPGDRADFVQFRWSAADGLRVEKTFLSGRLVYSAAS